MFKNLFKLGKDSSGLNSSDKFEVQQQNHSTCPVEYENYGNILSSIYNTQDMIISIIQRIDRLVILSINN